MGGVSHAPTYAASVITLNQSNSSAQKLSTVPRPDFDFSPEQPASFTELLWNVFFASRHRGVDLQTHFPWLVSAPLSGVWFATLRESGTLVAGLVVKELPGNAATAAIGLVCVHPDRRGQGLARQLIDGAIRQSHQTGLHELTLWTGKPEIYVRHGFETDDEGRLGWVTEWPAATGQTRELPMQVLLWPDQVELAGMRRGLPPYASHAQRVTAATGSAEALIVFDSQGPALAEWRGSDREVLDLLAARMPTRWRINAIASDTLPAALSSSGARVDMQANRLQMWRTVQAGPSANRPALRLLDRI